MRQDSSNHNYRSEFYNQERRFIKGSGLDAMHLLLSSICKDNSIEEMEKIFIEGEDLYESGNYEEALMKFNALVFGEYKGSNALWGIANCLFMLEKYEQAFNVYKSIVDNIQEDFLSTYYMAECKLNLGDTEKAIHLYEIAANLASDSAEDMYVKNNILAKLTFLADKCS